MISKNERSSVRGPPGQLDTLLKIQEHIREYIREHGETQDTARAGITESSDS